MTRWSRRILTGAICVALIAALGVPAMASGGTDPSLPGVVTLTVTDESGQREDLASTNVDVFVYKVAGVDESESGLYTLEARFEALAENAQWNGGKLSGETLMEDLQAAALDVLAAEASLAASDESETDEAALPEPDFKATVSAVGGEIELPEKGLYLLVPQSVATARWDYTFSPILLAMPSFDQTTSSLSYAFDVTMKPLRESRLTGIVISKTLQSYNATLGPTTFLFEVKATVDGEVVYSNVAGLTFSGTGTQSTTVEGIPAGADVTVTEVYSGTSYTPVGGRVSVEIEDLPMPEDGGTYTRVPFTNDYNNLRVPDSAVTNTFVYNGTGWQWQGSQEAEG